MKDYYQILNLSREAKPDKIRRQYRLLVLTWHPDRFVDPEEKVRAEEVIKEINEAYAVLRDPAKRARYDRRTRKPVPVTRPQQPAYPSPGRVSHNWAPAPPAPQAAFLHEAFYAGFGDAIEVSLDRQANVILLDEMNYLLYRLGADFHYTGGYAHVTPVLLPVPRRGVWHLVVDLGGSPGTIRATARVIR